MFANGKAEYAIPAGAVSDPDRLRKLSAFFFWTSWAPSTNRPERRHHLHAQLALRAAGRQPAHGRDGRLDRREHHHAAGGHLGDGLVVRRSRSRGRGVTAAGSRPAGQTWVATPSQKATVKYFWVVSALILVQMLLGVVTAHYGVEGDGFYGIPLSEWLPYSVTRTWHIQMGLFWIATAWLAAGLFIGPLVSEHEPKGQRLGVNILFAGAAASSWSGRWPGSG